MRRRQETSPTRAKLGDAPQGTKRDPLDAHDFADGGGSGGAERFSRRNTRKKLLRRR